MFSLARAKGPLLAHAARLQSQSDHTAARRIGPFGALRPINHTARRARVARVCGGGGGGVDATSGELKIIKRSRICGRADAQTDARADAQTDAQTVGTQSA